MSKTTVEIEGGDSASPTRDTMTLPVRYPSYVSFDQFIDVERLRSLDTYIRSRIRRRLLEDRDLKFYTGPFTLSEADAGRPGSRMIYLSESESPDSYFDLDRTELWHPSPAALDFAMLTEFISTLPFKSTGRILIMYDDVPRPVPAHRDHTDTGVCHEFIWMRTRLNKPFYVHNCETGERRMIDGYSAWFDTVNQFHGSDPVEDLAFSIRVDGRFTDDFRSRIPEPGSNRASMPSVWAAALKDKGETNGKGAHRLC